MPLEPPDTRPPRANRRAKALRGLPPTFAVLLVSVLVTGLAWAHRLPGGADGAAAEMRREVLLSYLPDVDRVSYRRDVLYLYSHGMPLMVVWVEDDPAQLYDADGRFVGPLDFQELSRVIRRASALMTHDKRWPTSPDHAPRDRA
jgi:hypothetical protein